MAFWIKEELVGSCIKEASEHAPAHTEAVAAEVINKTPVKQTMVGSHYNLLELFQDPALEELVGAVADIHLEADS